MGGELDAKLTHEDRKMMAKVINTHVAKRIKVQPGRAQAKPAARARAPGQHLQP